MKKITLISLTCLAALAIFMGGCSSTGKAPVIANPAENAAKANMIASERMIDANVRAQTSN